MYFSALGQNHLNNNLPVHMNMSDQHDFALFKKEREHIKARLGDETWVTAYYFFNDKQQTTAWYCGLIKNSDVPNSLKYASWELGIGSGFPGCSMSGFGDDRVVTYNRYGFQDAEPFIFLRKYGGFRNGNTEISEEFRFFHNLYYESKRNEYIKLDESGEEATVIRFDKGAVLIRLKEIRQFLAIKDMHMALFFDHFRRSNIDVSTIPEDYREEFHSDSRTLYQFRITNDDFFSGDFTTVSSIFGKKMISPFPKSKSGFWPYTQDEQEVFEEFVIDETPDGDPITFTCNHNKLANYFGANPEAPHYLTQVYFKREVLQRYYNDPARFSVEDSYLRCGDQWGLYMDNNLEDVVIVYLGDLGRDLPAKERAYWKPYNIPPKGRISKTKIMRDFMGQPSDPEGTDLLFKQRYQQLNEVWTGNYGWPLFLPLKDDDIHFLQNLRVLLNNSQSEFDSQILALAKVLVDALNEAEIEKRITTMPYPPKGIAKLSTFLLEKNYSGSDDGIDVLKLIQGLRSTGVAHLKGSNYQKLAEKYGLAEKELRVFFSNLLLRATIFLENLLRQTDKTSSSSKI